jgi:hypothetical protein
MEEQAKEVMERQSERLTDYPEVKARVQTHLRETEEQLTRLERCLSSTQVMNGYWGDQYVTVGDTLVVGWRERNGSLQQLWRLRF